MNNVLKQWMMKLQAKFYQQYITVSSKVLFWFIAKHKGKPGSIFKPGTGSKTVKPYTIIKSKQTKHGQEESHTNTGASAQTEWIIIIEIIPSVSCFKKCQTIDRTSRVGHQRIAHFQRVFI